ncbi:hypothetical protein [Dyadobacter sp. BHUBP1]|uniref:hypothetical protein n=1 Tax=Dyadobacter sp. BHUBP1 TaxID=3424178 RepID=UPI003D326560
MKYFSIIVMMMVVEAAIAQTGLKWIALPDLPDKRGFAGMYGGVSHGALLCLGGANFPDGYPWEGGVKKWHDGIFLLQEGGSWRKLPQKMETAAGYGVSVSHQERVILIGGSNAHEHLSRVIGYEWNGPALVQHQYPSLPFPLANMSGAVLDDLLIVVGGNVSPTGPGLNKCLVLDLKQVETGWAEWEAWPGPGRIFPVCATFDGDFYMFSGETTAINSRGNSYRLIHQDGYRLNIQHSGGQRTAHWEKLAAMPRGMSAGGSLLPVLKGDRFLFWGGVDAVTAQHKTPSSHPGITNDVLYYFPHTDSWEFAGRQQRIPARVTLPVVQWQNQWFYISGEIKPGIRTPAVIGVY